MRKRWVLTAGMIAGLVGVVLLVLALLPRPGVTKANFGRIQKGMSKPEIQAILGKHWFGFDHVPERFILVGENWRADDGAEAYIEFERRDGDETTWRVCSMSWQESSETPFQKIRRWVGLAPRERFPPPPP